MREKKVKIERDQDVLLVTPTEAELRQVPTLVPLQWVPARKCWTLPAEAGLLDDLLRLPGASARRQAQAPPPPRRRRLILPADRSRIRKLYGEGFSVRYMAEKFRLSKSTIQRIVEGVG